MRSYYILCREQGEWRVKLSCPTKRDVRSEAEQLKQDKISFKVISGSRFEYYPGDVPKENSNFLTEGEY